MTHSPYTGLKPDDWSVVTQKLVRSHPLDPQEIVDVVLYAWGAIFDSRFGKKGFRIGREIFPKPQILGFLLHELIPLELAARYPTSWRGDQGGSDKDLVYVPDDQFSVEVKTSSHPSQIFGNRSYAQASTSGKKAKSGYYLTVNFGACSAANPNPPVNLIKFGWIDSHDWIGQKAATGQQSRLPPEVQNHKLLVLYKAK